MATQYLGTDVLDETTPNMRDGIAETFDRFGRMVENPTGRRLWDDWAGEPIPSRTFAWFADSRAEIEKLRTFLDTRKGRLTPFWVPTFGHDLQMTQDELAASSSITVRNWGYGQFLFPINARKHIALVKPDGSFLMRKATLVVDNGATETITLDAGHGEDLSASVVLPCFLVICRQDEDTVQLRWENPNHVEVDITFREVPKEAPA